MALGSLLGAIGSGLAKAASNYANEKKKNNTTSSNSASNNTTKTTTTPTTTPTNATNEHASYINQNYQGGLGAYTKLQQDRYNQALQNNDVDLLNRLNADSQKVGYNLTNQNVAPQFNAQPYIDQINALMNENYQNQLSQIPMPDYSMYEKNMNNFQDDMASLLGTLENYQGADSMSMDESMARAYSQLNGIYNANLDKTLENYNKNAVSRGMFGQLPVEALKQNAISETELNKSKATNDLATNLFGQDYNMARQKDADFYKNINQQAGLLTNLYNTEADQYQNAINEYMNTVNMANMKDDSYYNDIARQLDLINSQYGASQDQYNNALKSFSTNYDIQSNDKNQQYEQALNKFNMGYADQSVADILGVPLGQLQQIIANSMKSKKPVDNKPKLDVQELTTSARLLANQMYPDGQYTQDQYQEIYDYLYGLWTDPQGSTINREIEDEVTRRAMIEDMQSGNLPGLGGSIFDLVR
jgi:hypothetical protein